MRKCLIIGHRGYPLKAPENTLKSFQMAAEQGADMVELDVQLTADNELVCIHDYEVSRTTSGSGSVHEMTLKELRELDAGDGERIPLLSEVLDYAKNTIDVNIELKIPGIENQVVDIIRSRTMTHHVLVSSFIHGSLQVIKDLDKTLKTAALVSQLPNDVVSYCMDLNVDALNPLYSLVNAELVEKLHCAGLEVFPWTVNDPQIILNMLDMNVDGIISDDVEVLANLIGTFK
ncbi:MAG: glycerophosphodiester phosphodiesterase [Candidatus Lokiarchaeota archaeon]|nr:glycerophosphodiester phosphodiesterase [Candidatus Lokiarchaeota archaeon]